MVSSNVNVLLYMYLFVCILLIVFNVFYIFYADLMKRSISRDAGTWVALLRKELDNVEAGGVSEKHLKTLQKHCSHTNGLLAYHRALESLKTEEDLLPRLSLYMKGCKRVYEELALKYIDKDDMNKAFMAYFVSDTFHAYESDYRRIYIILKAYMDESSIYCRENILKALYALGDANNLCDFLLVMDGNEMYHNRKLLTDGLCAFNGDKEMLAKLLWSHKDDFSEETLLSIIGFITFVSDGYGSVFQRFIESKTTSLEEKLACLRYFRRHKYENIVPLLYEYMNEDVVDVNISIVTASVLSAYKSDETKAVLTRALTSRNWYIRLNAANSLVDFDLSPEDIKDILSIKDKYAKEVMIYVLDERGIDVPVC